MKLKDVSIDITKQIVYHSKGYFTITRDELIKSLDTHIDINYDYVNKLYDEKYSPKHWAA